MLFAAVLLWSLPLQVFSLPAIAGRNFHVSIASDTPQQMYASEVTAPHPDPCAEGLNDLGVHAFSRALERLNCDMHLERVQRVVVPVPRLEDFGPGHALVRVRASSVNPSTWKGLQSNTATYRLGSDFAGEIESVMQPCSFSHGDRVWGMIHGSYAQYAVVQCDHTGHMPANFGFPSAAVLPLVSLTGLQALRWAGAPWSNAPTVLVLGGSGGTGSVGIQLARALGAGRIISTSSESNFDTVRRLGADEVIDYHTANWWEVLPRGSVDVIYDCVCITGTGNQAYSVLADGGRFVTIQGGSVASPATAAARPAVSQHGFLLDQTATSDLNVLRDLAERNRLYSPIHRTYTLDSIAEAFQMSMSGDTVGKISVVVE